MGTKDYELTSSNYDLLIMISVALLCLSYTFTKKELLALREHRSSSPVLWLRSVLFIFLDFYVVFLFLSSCCVLCPILPVSLDCPFLTLQRLFDKIIIK